MATVRDAIIKPALREIGVLAAGADPSYEEGADSLQALNDFIDSQALERLTIHHITRTVLALTASVAEYIVGDVEGYGADVTDGFDTTWGAVPPEWVAASTGDGTISNETTIVQAGGHSVKANAALGTGSIYRDFTVFSGTSATFSIYMYGNAATACVVRVLCVETAHYLTSAGAWQTASADVFSQTASAWTAKTITFNVEDEAIVSADIATLRVTLYADSFAAPAYFDTLVLANAVAAAPLINIPRPVFIDHVNLIDTSTSPDTEIPLTSFTDDAWAGVVLKAQTATWPTSWYYNPTAPRGTLSLWPVPTGSDISIALYVPTQVSEFADLDDDVTLPQGYRRMLYKNLALELCPTFGAKPHPLLQKQAADSLAAVKRANVRLTDLRFDSGALIGNRGRTYDIRTG